MGDKQITSTKRSAIIWQLAKGDFAKLQELENLSNEKLAELISGNGTSGLAEQKDCAKNTFWSNLYNNSLANYTSQNKTNKSIFIIENSNQNNLASCGLELEKNSAPTQYTSKATETKPTQNVSTVQNYSRTQEIDNTAKPEGTKPTQNAPAKTEQPVEEVKEEAIEHLNTDIDAAIKAFLGEQEGGGHIKDLVNSAKELFGTEYAASKVYRNLIFEKQSLSFLECAKAGKLTKKEYFEEKLYLIETTLEEIDSPAIQYLKSNLKKLTPKEYTALMNIMTGSDDSSFKSDLEKFANDFSLKTAKQTDAPNGTTLRPTTIGSIMNGAEADEKISFEEVFKHERGVEYNSEAITKYSENETQMKLIAGMHNQITSIKASLKNSTALVEGNNKYGVSPIEQKVSNARLNAEIITVLRTLYGDDDNAIKSALKTKYGVDADIVNGQIDFSGIKNDSYNLVALSKNIQSKLDEQFKKVLGDKTLEEHQLELKNTYQKAYGDKNSTTLTKAFIQSQNDGVNTVKVVTTGAGFVMVVAGQLVPVLGIPISYAGMGLTTLGGSAVSIYENITKADKITQKDIQEMKEELTKSLAGFAMGAGIGKISSSIYAQMIMKNCPKLAAFAAERGTDATMSLISNWALTGQVDISRESIAQLIATTTGIIKAKSGNGIYNKNFFKNNYEKAGFNISSSEDQIAKYYKRLIPNITDEEVSCLVQQYSRLKNGQNRWLNDDKEQSLLESISNKVYAQSLDKSLTPWDIYRRELLSSMAGNKKIPFKNANLSEKEEDMLKKYYEYGSGYFKNETEWINGQKHTNNYRDEFNQLFNKIATTLDEDYTVYRGVGVRRDCSKDLTKQKEFLNTIKVGAILNNDLQSSTATGAAWANGYSGGGAMSVFENGYILKIKLPKGSRVMDMRNINKNSHSNKEAEIVLPENAQLRITAVDYQSGIVECEYILPD